MTAVPPESEVQDPDADILSELDTFDPVTSILKLSFGDVRVRRLKTREFFRLLRVITRGGGPLLANLNFNEQDMDQFIGQFIGIVVFAIPEAESPAIDFIRSIVEPADIDNISKEEEKTIARAALWDVMENPEIEDVVDVIEAVIRQEAEDIQSLGKRVQRWLALARKTGQLKPERTTGLRPLGSTPSESKVEPESSQERSPTQESFDLSEDRSSSEPSSVPSTSSSESMVGQTT